MMNLGQALSTSEIDCNSLIVNGIISQSGEINKDKINLISGTVTPPFVESVWVMTAGDADTVARMKTILTTLFNEGRTDEMLDILRLLYGVLGLRFPPEVEQLAGHPEAARYFLFSFLLDIDDTMQDYIAET